MGCLRLYGDSPFRDARLAAIKQPARHCRQTKEGNFNHVLFEDSPVALVATLCMLGLLTCAAQEPAESSEVSYLSFQVPGAFETNPVGINDSNEVTGSYSNLTFNGVFAFVRSADGVITTFSVSNSSSDRPGCH
jgi:hypothetical protein